MEKLRSNNGFLERSKPGSTEIHTGVVRRWTGQVILMLQSTCNIDHPPGS